MFDGKGQEAEGFHLSYDFTSDWLDDLSDTKMVVSLRWPSPKHNLSLTKELEYSNALSFLLMLPKSVTGV